MAVNRGCPNIGMHELEREINQSVSKLKRKTSILAYTAMVACVSSCFITVVIQTAKKAMKCRRARVPKTVVLELDGRQCRRRVSLMERQP